MISILVGVAAILIIGSIYFFFLRYQTLEEKTKFSQLLSISGIRRVYRSANVPERDDDLLSFDVSNEMSTPIQSLILQTLCRPRVDDSVQMELWDSDSITYLVFWIRYIDTEGETNTLQYLISNQGTIFAQLPESDISWVCRLEKGSDPIALFHKLDELVADS